jgi:hypothetical protein
MCESEEWRKKRNVKELSANTAYMREGSEYHTIGKQKLFFLGQDAAASQHFSCM